MITGLSKHIYWQLPLLLMVLLLGLMPAQGGKLYKWVDETGQIRYGDRIPPQFAKRKQDTLNEQGVVVNTRAAAKTEQQLAEERRIAEAAAEEKRLRDENNAYNRVLLDTFTTEDDMIMTRNGKVDAIEAAVRLTRARTEKAKQRLLGLTRRAANMERAGRPIPKPLYKEITDARSQIKYNNRYIANRLEEQQAVRQQFESDLKRFRELKSVNTVDEKVVNRESASLPLHP
ncbi:MAG: DUF4124 domain-containing protein [Gammaproteobacteria bacterium]